MLVALAQAALLHDENMESGIKKFDAVLAGRLETAAQASPLEILGNQLLVPAQCRFRNIERSIKKFDAAIAGHRETAAQARSSLALLGAVRSMSCLPLHFRCVQAGLHEWCASNSCKHNRMHLHLCIKAYGRALIDSCVCCCAGGQAGLQPVPQLRCPGAGHPRARALGV